MKFIALKTWWKNYFLIIVDLNTKFCAATLKWKQQLKITFCAGYQPSMFLKIIENLKQMCTLGKT